MSCVLQVVQRTSQAQLNICIHGEATWDFRIISLKTSLRKREVSLLVVLAELLDTPKRQPDNRKRNEGGTHADLSLLIRGLPFETTWSAPHPSPVSVVTMPHPGTRPTLHLSQSSRSSLLLIDPTIPTLAVCFRLLGPYQRCLGQILHETEEPLQMCNTDD